MSPPTPQIPFDATVRISLDTNLCMIKENPEDGPSCAATGRWYRDPSLPVHRTEITRFPHAVLEVKLSLQEGQTAPAWVQVRGQWGVGKKGGMDEGLCEGGRMPGCQGWGRQWW